MIATHYRVHSDGTRALIEHETPELALTPIVIGDALEDAQSEVETLRWNVEDLCGLLGVDCQWGVSGANPFTLMERAILDLKENQP